MKYNEKTTNELKFPLINTIFQIYFTHSLIVETKSSDKTARETICTYAY